MIRFRVRKILKFKSLGSHQKIGSHRKALKRFLTVPQKFARVFHLTAAAYRAASRIEREEGHMPRGQLQAIMLTWARNMLALISVEVEIKGIPPELKKPILFVGNHLSYVDIPLLMASVPVVFVAKEEVSKWLVIGQASRKAGTVFVKRENFRSRAGAATAIADTILKRQQSIAVFPSGTTCIAEDRPWRHGAFKIAEQHKIDVQPFRIRYEPLRKVAYIDDDKFATHLLSLLRLERVKAIIEFDYVRPINDSKKDCAMIQNWTREPYKDYVKSSDT